MRLPIGVQRFIFTSTCSVYGASDQLLDERSALNPVSLYACTKIDSKRVLLALNDGRFAPVILRFGNVLGSRGSLVLSEAEGVVPTFERQIEQGGPVTVTHPDMTRYFMSVSEAVSLIIQAAALTQGDDLFMLDMGQRIRF